MQLKTSLRDVILSNPTLATVVRENDAKRVLAAKPLVDLRYRRDVAIAALIKARKNHRKTRPLLTTVFTLVDALRARK